MTVGPLRTTLLMPWWVASLATGAKSFIDHPLIGSRRLNEAGLHVARVRLAHALAARRRARIAGLVRDEDRAAFARDGFVVRHDFLPPAVFERLREGLQGWRGPCRDMRQGDAVTRRFALDPALLATVPEARALLAHPDWQGLIRYVASFDREPVSYVQTILAQRGDGSGRADPQLRLHADAFQPSAKAWLFLDDVAPDEGPLTYVPGSHRLTPQRIAWEKAMSLAAPQAERLTARGSFRVGPNDLAEMGLSPPRAFAVPANTLVVADTYGFHARGPSVRPSRRTEIWAYSRHNPFNPWSGADLAAIPAIRERRVGAYWKGRDLLARWLGQPWKAAGIRSPFDAELS
ncbi:MULTISPECIES: phytanoyl-CoA dioxygenase family protein [Novosphingobium]|uniref:phytanoyl-CoA dioxygenase family protein n=1 Tax=Novosphingobium TaxID=165696 RepID=UPI001CD41502|nr:phytanoyl-CoA dioxygenase family protein [Novosphingobium percolationis]MCH7628736.1 phytanoyl-CoA dioxygenase family protein [Pseudomonadota bacterium]